MWVSEVMGMVEIEACKKFGIDLSTLLQKLEQYTSELMENMTKHSSRVNAFDEVKAWLSKGNDKERDLKLFTMISVLDLCATIALLNFEIGLRRLKLRSIYERFAPILSVIHEVVVTGKNDNDDVAVR